MKQPFIEHCSVNSGLMQRLEALSQMPSIYAKTKTKSDFRLTLPVSTLLSNVLLGFKPVMESPVWLWDRFVNWDWMSWQILLPMPIFWGYLTVKIIVSWQIV